MKKKVLLTAVVLGALSVLLGAFAAHGLESVIDEEAIDTFETGVRYQFYYAMLLLFLGIQDILDEKYLRISFYLILIGVILFSGSIYGLATNDLTAFNFKTIAWLTPIGGVFLIAVWVVLFLRFFKTK